MLIDIYTMGRFSLVKASGPLHFGRKAKKKPIHLLKAIIALGGRGLPKEIVADALWPDSEGDKAAQVLATTLHRLRKLLEIPDVIQLDQGCLSINRELCAIDIWKFERLCGAADKLWMRKDSLPTAIKLSHEAIGLYKGNFLAEDSDETWTLVQREKLRSKYMRCVGKLGYHYERHDDFESAVECYQKSIEANGMAEEPYRRLMACYNRMGLKAEALSVYQQCRSILTSVHGLKPSYDTEVIKRCIAES